MALLLAAAKTVDVLIWVAVLILCVIGLGLAILAMRRRLLSRDADSDFQSGILDSLRAMRDEGRLTQEEYDAARRRMTARFAGKAERPAPSPALGPAVPDPGTSGLQRRPLPPDELRAPPGFDLTGRPLPRPDMRPPPHQ